MITSGSAAVLLLMAAAATADPSHVDTASLRNLANVSYAAENSKPTGISSLFSPRMEFEQWKPLTGRGDPLRNDPTYDYEPPMLDHVHFWYDEARLEREHYPEKKSEVLVLGVSSRKPSVPPRPPVPPKRYHRPTPNYEDYTYKLSNHYPMTILVPPPLPPPGHKLPLFILSENTSPNSFPKPTEVPILNETTTTNEQLTSLYSLQEGNLVYQSSTTSQNWILDDNQYKQPSSAVSSDFSGWGPTTPLDETAATNEKQNFIPNDKFEFSKHPYSFYKPMLSEAPPPPRVTANPLLLPTFVPTAVPSTTTPQPPATTIKPALRTTTDFYTESQDYYEQTTTEKIPPSKLPVPKPSPLMNMLDMLKPMLSMPLVNGPDRPEDNLYEHASESMQIFKEQEIKQINIETMQTMQPPPQNTELPVSQKYPIHISHNSLIKEPVKPNHDPYLHMRFTTPKPIKDTQNDYTDSTRPTETPSETVTPMYLIIQGHSKVKTYGSKPKLHNDHTIKNEIPKRNETTEVKHLHTNKEKYRKADNVDVRRKGRAQSLRSLLDNGFGSIEIQEADVGIKYDVSDGSEVPVEIYRKGIVDNGENDYVASKKAGQGKRSKKQVDLEEILPFDEDVLEEYVYDYFKGKQNETSITGLIAQAVTSDAASVVDDLEDDDDDQNT